MTIDTDRAIGAMLGLAVGDALGTTLEFSPRDSCPPVLDIVGGGPFDLEPGQWTDDTSMALCLAESLIACGELVADDVMTRFLAWYREGENSCTGACFDIGTTTRAALTHYERTGQLIAPGDPAGAGNGSLMRIAPIALFHLASSTHVMGADAERQSYLTHPAPEAAQLCRRFAKMLALAIGGASRGEILAGTNRSIVERTREDVRSTGYVRDTFEAAIWAVWNTTSFDEAVQEAANLGDDADTVAAVTGQLAGAIYGATAIPPRWRKVLAWHDHIEERARALLQANKGAAR